MENISHIKSCNLMTCCMSTHSTTSLSHIRNICAFRVFLCCVCFNFRVWNNKEGGQCVLTAHMILNGSPIYHRDIHFISCSFSLLRNKKKKCILDADVENDDDDDRADGIMSHNGAEESLLLSILLLLLLLYGCHHHQALSPQLILGLP